MNHWKGVLIAVFILSATGAYACEFAFTLISENGSTQRIQPGSEVELDLNNTYTLKVALVEDHRNCHLTPEDTDFLLEEEKWKTTKDYLPLQLLNDISWTSRDHRHHKVEISFQTVISGTSSLEVLRDCDKKEGYDEFLHFVVK